MSYYYLLFILLSQLVLFLSANFDTIDHTFVRKRLENIIGVLGTAFSLVFCETQMSTIIPWNALVSTAMLMTHSIFQQWAEASFKHMECVKARKKF